MHMGGEGLPSPPRCYDGKEMSMRNRKVAIILVLGFLVGVSLLLYPSFSNYWNRKTQTRAISNYESVLENLEPEDYSYIFDQAHDYNRRLFAQQDPLLYHDQVPGYYESLNVSGNGMIGYLKIERINVELPVYHGTSVEVLNVGVGHLEGSSLPVGGESTHSVLSAHRGLPNAKLFTDLDRVEIGDTFQITVLDQVLTYRVDQIKIITPYEISDLEIIPGKDHCTLFTCTPYGINTHRLLVRAHQVDASQKSSIYIANEAYRVDPLIVMPGVAMPFVIGWLLYVLIVPVKKEALGEEI